MVMEQCGQRYHERMADISEKVVSHIASIYADSILSRSSQVEKINTVARRTFWTGQLSVRQRHAQPKCAYWRTCDCSDQTEERVAILCLRARRSAGVGVCPRFRPGRHSGRVQLFVGVFAIIAPFLIHCLNGWSNSDPLSLIEPLPRRQLVVRF